MDDKIVKGGGPHDRDASTNVVAQREKIDHLSKRDQWYRSKQWKLQRRTYLIRVTHGVGVKNSSERNFFDN